MSMKCDHCGTEDHGYFIPKDRWDLFVFLFEWGIPIVAVIAGAIGFYLGAFVRACP